MSPYALRALRYSINVTLDEVANIVQGSREKTVEALGHQFSDVLLTRSKTFRQLPVVAALLPLLPSQMQTQRPLPIIDMHLHTAIVGDTRLGLCTPRGDTVSGLRGAENGPVRRCDIQCW